MEAKVKKLVKGEVAMNSSNAVVKRGLRLAVAALVAFMVIPSTAWADDKETKKDETKKSSKEMCLFVKSEDGWTPEKLEGIEADDLGALEVGEAHLKLKDKDKNSNMSFFLQTYKGRKPTYKSDLLEMGQVFMYSLANGYKGKSKGEQTIVKEELLAKLSEAPDTDFGVHGVKDEDDSWSTDSSREGITSMLTAMLNLDPKRLVKMSFKERTDFVKSQLKKEAADLGLGKGEDCTVAEKEEEKPTEPTTAKDDTDKDKEKDSEPSGSPAPAAGTEKTPPTAAAPTGPQGPEQPFNCAPSNNNNNGLLDALTSLMNGINNQKNPLDALKNQVAARGAQPDNRDGSTPAQPAPASAQPPATTPNENPFSTPLARDGKADPVNPIFPPLQEVEQANTALAAFDKPKDEGDDRVASAKAAVDTGKRVDTEIASKSKETKTSLANLNWITDPMWRQIESMKLAGNIRNLAERAKKEASFLAEKSKNIGNDIAFLKKASKKLKDVPPNEDFGAMETRLAKQVQDLKKYQEQVGGSSQETATAAQDGGQSVSRFMSAISQKVNEAQEQLKIASLLKSLGKKGVANSQEAIDSNVTELENQKSAADAQSSALQSQGDSLDGDASTAERFAMMGNQSSATAQQGLNGAKLLPAGGSRPRPTSGFGASQGAATNLLAGGPVVRGGLGPTSNPKSIQ